MEYNETTPLLADEAGNSQNTPENESRQDALPWRVLPAWSPVQRRTIIVAALLLVAANGGNYLATPPQIQIIQDIICRNHLRSIDPNAADILSSNGNGNGSGIVDGDDICKSPAVQSELALVIEWKYTLDILPTIALALPYGVLADKIGRRPILMMSLASLMASEIWDRIVCWFNLPIRLLWIGGLFQVPGGGQLMAISMIFTIVTDAFSPEERSTTLFQLTAMSFLAEMIATPVSAWMLTRFDPWYPYLLGITIMVICSTGSFFIPETLDLARAKPDDGHEEDGTQNFDESASQLPAAKRGTVMDTVFSRVQEFISSSKFIWTQPRVLISILTVFTGSLDISSWHLLIQYVSAKFHWSISRASFLISVRGFMALGILLVIVPLIASFMVRRLHYDAVRKDLTIARLAAVSGIIGYFLIFAAPSAPLYLVGTFFVALSLPFVGSLFSASTSFVTSKNQVATLYAAMSVSRSVGNVIAGPIFAYLYALGMRLGLEWSGLPFAMASLIFFVTIIPLLCIRA